MNHVKEILKKGRLLFDGGMGTYISAKEHTSGQGCELASVDKPVLVSAIHREYLEAGARALKTNTFAANRTIYDEETCGKILHASWNLAVKAAEPFQAEVFADFGPVTGRSAEEAAEEYRWTAGKFIDMGAENFLFETLPSLDGVKEAAAYIRSRVSDPFIVVSFALLPEGYTRDGQFGNDLINEAAESGLFDAVGMNCVVGVRQMAKLLSDMTLPDLPLSIMPNAGYPTVIDNRTFYDSDPVYFGDGMAQLAADGVKILGGCCGTTPRHIEAVRKALEAGGFTPQTKHKAAREKKTDPDDSLFWRKLKRGEKVIAVELDPPVDTNLLKYMAGAAQLGVAGTDIVTIADCPVARARMDSSLLACKIRSDLGMEALPHMTCRDRNLNATKGLLLGLSAVGVRNVLVVTGDPIPTAERDEVKSVFQFNSRKMASFIQGLGKTELPAPFHVFGALNLNARNFEVELNRAKEKLQRGMVGFLTQPVLSDQALENLKLARKELNGGYILGGIIPIVSERNARFMDAEISGISVAPEIIEKYHGLSKEEAAELAVSLSTDIAEKIAPYTDGWYLITPFGRVGLMKKIIAKIKG